MDDVVGLSGHERHVESVEHFKGVHQTGSTPAFGPSQHFGRISTDASGPWWMRERQKCRSFCWELDGYERLWRGDLVRLRETQNSCKPLSFRALISAAKDKYQLNIPTDPEPPATAFGR